MNILIKNADFSEVSIGNVTEIEKSCVLTHLYLRPSGLSYITTKVHTVAFDITSVDLKEIVITGAHSSSNVLAAFYNGECPTTDMVFSDSDEVSSFESALGSRLEYINPSQTGVVTVTTTVPNGAKTLLVYVSLEDVEIANVKFILQ